MNVPNHEKKAFHKLSDVEKLAIISAKFNDSCQVFHGHWFDSLDDDNICLTQIYRTRPLQLVIPWEVIKPEYQWAAMDEGMDVLLYEKEPTIGMTRWKDGGESVGCYCLNINTTGIYWRESMVQRPE